MTTVVERHGSVAGVDPVFQCWVDQVTAGAGKSVSGDLGPAGRVPESVGGLPVEHNNEIRYLVLRYLATRRPDQDRVSRAELRAQLPEGWAALARPGSPRAAKGSKSRGNEVTNRLRQLVMELEKDGLVRREPEHLLILDRPALKAALDRMYDARGRFGLYKRDGRYDADSGGGVA